MKSLGSLLAQAYGMCWETIEECCAPLTSRLDDGRPHNREKEITVLHDQPEPVPHPWAGPDRPSTTGSLGHRLRKKSLGSTGDAKKKRFRSKTLSGSSRRPQISAPTDFRHVYSESFQFPGSQANPQRRARPSSFRPLELSIYLPQNRLSSLLPHFDFSTPAIPAPPPARTRTSFDDDKETLNHERSYSSMSFHIPRRPLRSDSVASHVPDETLPRIPPKARARARAYTVESVDEMIERVASAMIEKDRLQAEIDSVVERSSIYINSRPSTAYGADELAPMPSIPALPPAAPSFAERLSTDRLHNTITTTPIRIPRREKSYEEASAVFQSSAASSSPPSPPSASRRRFERSSPDRPLAPPLPLVLRPPLRKKKSFSRVSSWLFLEQHQRGASVDSVTNLPKPVTGREGFYQCVAPTEEEGDGETVREGGARDGEVSSLSTWETSDDEEVYEEKEDDEETETDRRTVPTSTWSPGSSPATKLGTPTHAFEKTGIFAPGPAGVDGQPRASRVGVAV